jgi:GNAT superfamily N-acetyltransferase
MKSRYGPEYFCESPSWSETLDDGSLVLIRPIRKQDREAERSFIKHLSKETQHMRFFASIAEPSEQMLDQFTNIDYVHQMAFVAVVARDAQETIVGVSRYSADRDETQCECAVTVDDEWQNKGLGTLLMKHLIEVARSRGIRRMVSIDSAENAQMRDLASHFGFHARIDPDDATLVLHELDLQPGP